MHLYLLKSIDLASSEISGAENNAVSTEANLIELLELLYAFCLL